MDGQRVDQESGPMWEAVASITKKNHLEVKVVLIDYGPQDWSPGFFLPTDGYGEAKSCGPFSFKELKELIINPIESRRIGVRVPNKLIDYTESLLQELTDCGVAFERRGELIAVQNIFHTT